MSRVSVIMPCRNGSKYIKQAIDSVITQTFTDWELFVIDNNSTDDSVEIVKSYAQKDNRIILLNNVDQSRLPAIVRNIGIEQATGQYIAFLDCDDMWLPTKLEHQLPLFEKSDCAVVFSYYKKMNKEGIVHKSVIKSPAKVVYKQFLKGDCIGNLTAMYDTEKVGKILQKDVHNEDYLMYLSILQKGFVAYNTNTVEAVYREYNTSLSGNKFEASRWTWNIYKNELKLPVIKCCWCFFVYAVKGLLKYLK